MKLVDFVEQYIDPENRELFTVCMAVIWVGRHFYNIEIEDIDELKIATELSFCSEIAKQMPIPDYDALCLQFVAYEEAIKDCTMPIDDILEALASVKTKRTFATRLLVKALSYICKSPANHG